ncbi:type I toxin-antitoxin system Fst family toxin [Staphylococcus xylosus]
MELIFIHILAPIVVGVVLRVFASWLKNKKDSDN